MPTPDSGPAAGETARAAMLAAALEHVPFEGWSEATFAAAARDSGVDAGLARVLFPRGALDLAVAAHRQGDLALAATLAGDPGAGLRFRDRVARAVRLRLADQDREVVRRGAALFALPQHAATGAQLVWGTADAIWRALGDRSDDFNWYTKRATLAAVYGATVLYWLGDDSPGQAETWAFLDRRIGEVMAIEQAKARLRETPALARLLAGPLALAERIRPPRGSSDLPGRTAGEAGR